jgi:hypothetical protein
MMSDHNKHDDDYFCSPSYSFSDTEKDGSAELLQYENFLGFPFFPTLTVIIKIY